ncbi:MAG: von Willebrand factor type A domain protein [candidate division BRC1 bacterium ADurb.BinA364]|nr:MAG: von Willebrand factor type A domain protein [candidate division BRC1 bacterium ADurb.BinA364]
MIVPGTDIRLLHPEFLGLIPVAFLLAYWRWRRRRIRSAAVRFSDLKHLRSIGLTLRSRLRGSLAALRLAAIALFCAAMARPQLGWRERDIKVFGLDIMLALDVSGSMSFRDFQPNRLEAAKEVISRFLDRRDTDRIGVVIFGNAPFTLCPLTLDYGVIKDFIGRLTFERLGEQNTALGLGLATAVDKLKDSDAKSKVVILLTDGVDTVGGMKPETAAEIAKSLGIRVYTIGVGSEGQAFAPGMGGFFGPMLTVQRGDFDEQTLRMIADVTGGKYFHATDNKSLEQVYRDIDAMEKSKSEYTEYDHYDEKMEWLAIPALLLLALELLLGSTVFLKLP